MHVDGKLRSVGAKSRQSRAGLEVTVLEGDGHLDVAVKKLLADDARLIDYLLSIEVRARLSSGNLSSHEVRKGSPRFARTLS